MLSVNKIQTNINYGSGMIYNHHSISNNAAFDKYDSYRRMNRALYDEDYVNGDISIWQLLSNKFRNLCYVLENKNPYLEEKSKMIEYALLNEAQSINESQKLNIAA